MLNELKKLQFSEASPIQIETFKHFNSQRNLVGIAPTGTGKTHAYLIPLVKAINVEKKDLQAIILIPTNELILQVREMLEPLITDDLIVKAYHSKMNKQREASWLERNNPHIVITTPERLIDMRSLGLNISTAKYLILDEADMMFDRDFLTQLDQIVSNLKQAKHMLFSATINENMYTFIRKYFGTYDLIDTTNQHELKITHKLVKSSDEERLFNLVRLTKILDPYLAIIFVSRKEDQNEVFLKLHEEGLNVVLLSGDLNQHKRKQVLSEIHNLKYQYVVASDLASRGIDFDASHVINYDLPYRLEFFRHRSGRTGRMDKEGEVITFASNDDRNKIKRLIDMGFDLKDYKLTDSSLSPILSKEKPLTKAEINAIKAIPKPKKVKPNYRKKNKKRIKEAKRSVRRKY